MLRLFAAHSLHFYKRLAGATRYKRAYVLPLNTCALSLDRCVNTSAKDSFYWIEVALADGFRLG